MLKERFIMNNCLILFGVSGILWLMFKLFEEISYKYWGVNEFIHRTFRMLTNVTEFLVLITLVFAIYIFILNY